MAASAWTVPSETLKLLGSGSIDLSSGNFRLVLLLSHAGAMPSKQLSALTFASLTTDGVSKHASVTGYSASGYTLVNPSWTLSGSTVKFDCQDVSISPTVTGINNVKVALIKSSAGDRIICFSTLTTTGNIDIAGGSKLTVTMNSGGIFTLAG